MKETKFIRVLSVIASVIAVCMYVSYIPQIINNLHGAYLCTTATVCRRFKLHTLVNLRLVQE